MSKASMEWNGKWTNLDFINTFKKHAQFKGNDLNPIKKKKY